jgi:predicted nucleic acid-binding protein
VSYLLDTNTVSELIKPGAAINVTSWLDHLDEGQVFLSVATFAEARRGVELMAVGRRRNLLKTWLDEELPTRFAGRILEIDRPVAESWGSVMARSQRLGKPISVLDGFFAGTAEVHGLTLATRNIRHFVDLGIPVYDPWTYLP